MAPTEESTRCCSWPVQCRPFVAVLLGWGVAGEALTPRMLAAGAAIVLAVVLIVRSTPSESHKAAPAATGLRRLTEREA